MSNEPEALVCGACFTEVVEGSRICNSCGASILSYSKMVKLSEIPDLKNKRKESSESQKIEESDPERTIFWAVIIVAAISGVVFLANYRTNNNTEAGATTQNETSTIEITIPDSEAKIISKLGIEITDCSVGALAECTIKYATYPNAAGRLKSFSLDKNDVLLEEKEFPTESIYPNTSVRTVIGYAPAGTQRIVICYDFALIGPNCQRPKGMQ